MKSIGALLMTVAVLVLVGLGITRIVAGYCFKMDCNQYLKRAADANTVELAAANLDKAVQFLEKKDLTNGVVGIFLSQPQNDIGFWYANLKGSQAELAKVTDKTTQMERSNLLMKLRETLLDNGKEGTEVTCPSGISIHPHNALMFWVVIAMVIMGGAGWLVYITSRD